MNSENGQKWQVKMRLPYSKFQKQVGKKRKYGLLKQAVIDGCNNGLTARELSDLTGASTYSIYSIARRMKVHTKYVYDMNASKKIESEDRPVV